MLYKYTEKKPYYYYDIIIAEYNDVIKINEDQIINEQRGVNISNGTHGIIQDIISKCEVYNGPVASEDLNIDDNGIDDVDGMKVLKIPEYYYYRLNKLGLLPSSVRDHNIGNSNYSEHTIQPWSIWLDYSLNPWDADIVKRVLRTKEENGMNIRDARILDYNKIIHICQERIRQLENC